MAKRIPPFYENWDNTHCAQCSLRGILEYFEPEEQWTWEDWDKFTAKEEGKYTWLYRGILNMLERVYQFKVIELFNVERYVGDQFYQSLIDDLGKEAADNQVKMAPDLHQLQNDMKHYIIARDAGLFTEEQRIPTIEDMRTLLNDGFLLFVSLNSNKLNGKEGYSSHFVLVYDMEDEFIYFQDSGPPSGAERKLPIEEFIAACINPTPHQWAIMAYKKL